MHTLLLFAFILASLFALALHLSPVDPLDPVPPEPGTWTDKDGNIHRPPSAAPLPPAEEEDPAPVSQRWGRLAPVALLVLGLLAPGVAHADAGTTAAVGGGIGALVIMGALALVRGLGLDTKVLSWLGGAKVDVEIPAHPQLSQGLTALGQAALHVVQDIVTPELLTAVEKRMETDSLASVGVWLAAQYGPKLLKDLEEQAETLAGVELKIIFQSRADLVEAATLKLGEAASKTLATAKLITKAPSGRPLVAVAPAAS